MNLFPSYGKVQMEENNEVRFVGKSPLVPTFHHLPGHKASLEEVTYDSPYFSKVFTFNHLKEATRTFYFCISSFSYASSSKESLCQCGIFGVAYSGLYDGQVRKGCLLYQTGHDWGPVVQKLYQAAKNICAHFYFIIGIQLLCNVVLLFCCPTR